ESSWAAISRCGGRSMPARRPVQQPDDDGGFPGASKLQIHGFATIACLNHYAPVVSEMFEALAGSGLYEASAGVSIAVLGPAAARLRVRELLAPYERVSIVYECDNLRLYEDPASAA